MGFGNKCPKLIAYRRLIRMNMPVDQEGKAHFTTTLFALIREALKIKVLSLQGESHSLKAGYFIQTSLIFSINASRS